MDEGIEIVVHFKPEAAQVLPAEIALLETILPEIIRAMMQAEEVAKTEEVSQTE